MPISSHELINFKTNYFVECGSAGLGLGIHSALIAGFPKVYSIDINPIAFNECQNIFKDDVRVNMCLGDCGEWLEPTLNDIGEPCTIYLDANGWVDETEHPFKSSVRAIIKNKRKDHIILVDDMNHGKNTDPNVVMQESAYIINPLKEINPDYTFYIINTHLEDLSHVFPFWVLVADPIPNRILNIEKFT